MTYTCARCMCINQYSGPCQCCGYGADFTETGTTIRVTEAPSKYCRCYIAVSDQTRICWKCGKKIRDADAYK